MIPAACPALADFPRIRWGAYTACMIVPRTMATCARAPIQTLVNAGVDTYFTNPGTSEMHFVALLAHRAHVVVCPDFYGGE